MQVHYERYGKYPQAYYEEPILNHRQKTLRAMFNELATERLVDGGYIPHSKMREFCEHYSLDFTLISYIIRSIENEVYQILREE